MAMTENDISGFEEKQSHQSSFDLTTAKHSSPSCSEDNKPKIPLQKKRHLRGKSTKRQLLQNLHRKLRNSIKPFSLKTC